MVGRPRLAELGTLRFEVARRSAARCTSDLINIAATSHRLARSERYGNAAQAAYDFGIRFLKRCASLNTAAAQSGDPVVAVMKSADGIFPCLHRTC